MLSAVLRSPASQQWLLGAVQVRSGDVALHGSTVHVSQSSHWQHASCVWRRLWSRHWCHRRCLECKNVVFIHSSYSVHAHRPQRQWTGVLDNTVKGLFIANAGKIKPVSWSCLWFCYFIFIVAFLGGVYPNNTPPTCLRACSCGRRYT